MLSLSSTQGCLSSPSAKAHSTVSRQWELLRQLPSKSPGITSSEIITRLQSAGYTISKRTIERDLIDLSLMFPLQCNDASAPYGWYWKPGVSVELQGPRCESERVVTKNTGRSTGGIIGSVGGAASGAAGAVSGAEIGGVLGVVGGPLGIALGGIAGAILGGLFGGVAGGLAGATIGEQLDERVLNNFECLECGHTFGANS